jgi:hypothetical protein
MQPRTTLTAMLILLSSAALSAQSNSDLATDTDDPSWVRAWLRIVDEARATQPHFVSPIVTTHIMLVQQVRYDMSWQQDPGGSTTSNYGNSRGLEIIPWSRIEVGIFPPGYAVHQTNTPNGFGDFSYQVKFRAFARPEGQGDYFIGFFLGGTVPTGRAPNGLGRAVLSPTLAVAKGLGPWDIQSTFGANLPAGGTSVLGRALVFNTAVDYRVNGKLWPMVEQNSTFWVDGPLSGDKQVFVTPGIVIGPFQVSGRLHVAFGAGVQIAITEFHQYNHRWVFSLRFPF